MDGVLLLINEDEIVPSDIKHINQLSYWDTSQTSSIKKVQQPAHNYMALPLNIAIFNGNIEAVTMLLDYGADPLLKDGLGRNALVSCIYGYDVYQLNSNTIEHISNQHNEHLQILSLLLEYLKKYDKIDLLNLPCSELNGITLLCFVSYLNKHLFVKLLLKYVDVNACDVSGSTPLMYAVRDQQINVIKLLVQHNANPYKKNKQGLDAFSYSNPSTQSLLKKDTIDISKELRLILDGPSSPTSITSSLPSPLSHDLSSLNYHSLDAISSKCDQDHSMFNSKDHHHNTLLHYACKLPNSEVIDYLLSFANPNALNIHNKTPLHYLVKKHKNEQDLIESAQLLLTKQADPTIKDKHGYSPIDYAMKYNYAQLCQLFTSNKSLNRKVNSQDFSNELYDILNKYDDNIPKGNKNRSSLVASIPTIIEPLPQIEQEGVEVLQSMVIELMQLVSQIQITPIELSIPTEEPLQVLYPVEIPVQEAQISKTPSSLDSPTSFILQEENSLNQFLLDYCNRLQQPQPNVFKQKWEIMINHVESLMAYLEEMQLISESNSNKVEIDERVQMHLEWYQSKLQETNASIYQLDALLLNIHEEKQQLYVQLQQLMNKRASNDVGIELATINSRKEELENDLHALTIEKMILYMDRCKELQKLKELEHCNGLNGVIGIVKQMVKNVQQQPLPYTRIDMTLLEGITKEEIAHKVVELEIHYELLSNLHKHKIINLENQYSDLLYDGQQKDEVIRQQDHLLMGLRQEQKALQVQLKTLSQQTTSNKSSRSRSNSMSNGLLRRINSTLHRRSNTEMSKTTFSSESDLSVSDEGMYPNAFASLSRQHLKKREDEKLAIEETDVIGEHKMFKRMNKSLLNLRSKFNMKNK